MRQATINDLSLLLYWDQKEHMMACDPDDDWNWAKELQKNPFWREQLVADLEDRPIGFVQIIDPHYEESAFWGAVSKNLRAIDIWIGEETDLNRGYGTQIMRLAIEKCFKEPSTKILIDPLKTNIKAHRFYERLGFKFLEERKFYDDVCFVYKLKREDYGDLNEN